MRGWCGRLWECFSFKRSETNSPEAGTDQSRIRARRSKRLGNRGERLAARTLRRSGFKILERKYTNHVGEIDLIARDGNTIVFVEVKTRSTRSAGAPVEAITAQKQRKLTQTALVYLKFHKLLDHSVRFDVVAIHWPQGGRPELEHYRNAFTPSGMGQMFS